jgi:hypothetical protein
MILQGQQVVDHINKLLKKSKQPLGNTACMDFDGVLAYHETGDPITKIGEPLKPGIDLAKQIVRQGYKLVVLTARPIKMQDEISDWLKKQGVKAQVTNVKPPAELYIDDRAIRYPKNFQNKQGQENGGDGSMNRLDGKHYKSLMTHESTSSRYLKNGKKKSLKQRISEGFFPEIQ